MDDWRLASAIKEERVLFGVAGFSTIKIIK